MTSERRSRGPVLATAARVAVLLAILIAPSAAAQRVVAVGDVHGSFDGFAGILRSAGLVDSDNRWVGGDAILVQVGDLTDRGPRVRAVLDLMIDLQAEAEAAGGRVVALLGNHEVNNLVSYFDPDSTPAETFSAIVGDFADDRSKSRSRKAYAQWRSWHERFPRCGPDHTRSTWLSQRPLGYVEYMEALGPEGVYGRWLRARPAVARIGDTIFVHGGLSPEPPAGFATDSLDAINRQVALEIERYDADRAWLVAEGISLPFSQLAETYCALQAEIALAEAGGERFERLQTLMARFPLPDNWLAMNGDGPLWFRGYARWTDAEGGPLIDGLAKTYAARRFVVGHTPQTGHITARFDDRVFLIDTAMVFGAAAGGRPAALEIDGGDSRAVYEGDPPPAAPPLPAPSEGGAAAPDHSATVWLDPDDNPLPFSNPDDVLEFLRTARVESTSGIEVGITQPRRLLLERQSLRSKAVFRHVDITKQRQRLPNGEMALYFRDNYIYEVAAYELSRLLGMDNVPPTVSRRVNHQSGSVQMWVEHAMMETSRREQKIEPPDRLHFTRQFYDMRVFDNLINNIDRNSGNILLDSRWKMWLIDHTRSFNRSDELPAPQDVVACSRTLFSAIKAFDAEVAAERLRPYLTGPEIAALLARRDRLVALIERRIAERGEAQVLFDYGAPDPGVQVTHEPAA